MKRFLNAFGRWLAWRERRNAPVDPPLANWSDRDLPPAVPGIGPPEPRGLRCSCGALAAPDEIDVCHRCRARRERREAEAEWYAEERRRKRREAARKRALAQKGVLEMPKRARGGR
jgi:hypothetical protein